MTVSDWSSTTLNSLSASWDRFITAWPAVIGAIVVIIIGVVVAAILRWAVETVLKAISIQRFFEQIMFAQILKKAGINNDISHITASFVWWVTIIMFILPAASLLGLRQVSDVLDSIINYLPNVGVVAVLIFFGAIFADFLDKVVRATASTVGTATSQVLGTSTRWIIYIFTALLALSQLGIPYGLYNTLFIGLVAALALGFGLSFGLGGKDGAADLIKKLRADFRRGE